jgi:hypothetical protein
MEAAEWLHQLWLPTTRREDISYGRPGLMNLSLLIDYLRQVVYTIHWNESNVHDHFQTPMHTLGRHWEMTIKNYVFLISEAPFSEDQLIQWTGDKDPLRKMYHLLAGDGALRSLYTDQRLSLYWMSPPVLGSVSKPIYRLNRDVDVSIANVYSESSIRLCYDDIRRTIYFIRR